MSFMPVRYRVWWCMPATTCLCFVGVRTLVELTRWHAFSAFQMCACALACSVVDAVVVIDVCVWYLCHGWVFTALSQMSFYSHSIVLALLVLWLTCEVQHTMGENKSGEYGHVGTCHSTEQSLRT